MGFSHGSAEPTAAPGATVVLCCSRPHFIRPFNVSGEGVVSALNRTAPAQWRRSVGPNRTVDLGGGRAVTVVRRTMCHGGDASRLDCAPLIMRVRTPARQGQRAVSVLVSGTDRSHRLCRQVDEDTALRAGAAGAAGSWTGGLIWMSGVWLVAGGAIQLPPFRQGQ